MYTKNLARRLGLQGGNKDHRGNVDLIPRPKWLILFEDISPRFNRVEPGAADTIDKCIQRDCYLTFLKFRGQQNEKGITATYFYNFWNI